MATITVEVPHAVARKIGNTISRDHLLDYMIVHQKNGMYFDEIDFEDLSIDAREMFVESEKQTTPFTSVKNR